MRSNISKVRKWSVAGGGWDDAITSVVGEMLLLVLVVILVSIMSASAFNLLPGERETSIDISMNTSTDPNCIFFWHHGGDWIDKRDLSVYIMKSEWDGTTVTIKHDDLIIHAYNSTTGDYSDLSNVFDLGCRIEAELPPSIDPGVYDIRFRCSEKVIAAYDGVTLS
ncbi:type IV pilin [Methanolacinia paynteri]|uniref:type IV pilin n=1 Tax=Methanolacinia paynteri TaxID=230356 RepID=UPI00064FDAE8|nr:type IV pilin [Methanolacinia paynteri]